MVEPLDGQALLAVSSADARWNVWDGAVRSGKTVSSLLAWLRFVREGPPGGLLMAGRTERTLKRNVIDSLVEMLGTSRCRLVAGSGELWLLGRRVYVVGGNDEVAQEKIRGLTLVGAYVDEASTIPESFWAMLGTRMSLAGARVFATTNPDGPRHWLKTSYLDRAALTLRDGEVVADRRDKVGDGEADVIDLHRFRFRLTDNPTLPEKYLADLRREYTGLWRRRLIDGEWTLASGVVYDMFDEARHVVAEVPELRSVLALGVDYGATNPTHAVVLGLAKDGRVVVTREYRHDPVKSMRALTIDEVTDELGGWLEPDRPNVCAVDPSAKALKVQMARDRRFKGLRDADNAVLDGILLVASLLSTDRMVIHESCEHLIDELGSYSWDDRAAARGEDKPMKVNDHAVDALRYACISSQSWWRKGLEAAVASPAGSPTVPTRSGALRAASGGLPTRAGAARR